MCAQNDAADSAAHPKSVTSYETECLKARVEHLKMIQAVIARMATASSDIKKFSLPVIGAMLAYSFPVGHWRALIPTLLITIISWYLDARYLWQEKCFRDLHDEVRKEGLATMPNFRMTPGDLSLGQGEIHRRVLKIMNTWSTKYVYLPLCLFIVAAILFFVRCLR